MYLILTAYQNSYVGAAQGPALCTTCIHPPCPKPRANDEVLGEGTSPLHTDNLKGNGGVLPRTILQGESVGEDLSYRLMIQAIEAGAELGDHLSGRIGRDATGLLQR
jgi:hypothetical protein